MANAPMATPTPIESAASGPAANRDATGSTIATGREERQDGREQGHERRASAASSGSAHDRDRPSPGHS